MGRIKIDLPEKFSFTTKIPIRITDINYGGHVGNDRILTIMHEARFQFFKKFGFAELEFAGTGIIISDAAIEYKNELFYGDIVIASIACGEFTKVSFELFYKLEKEVSGKQVLVAVAKTGIVCYDYKNKKVVLVPDEARLKLTSK